MTKAVKKESKKEKPRITSSEILEETARFVRGITGKYTLYSIDLVRISGALNAVAKIDEG